MKRHHKLMKSTANASLQDNDDIDFLKLRDKYPHLLQQYINKNDKIIDFTDANAMRALTTAYLLELDVSIELPSDRLCPPVPGRLAYIDWLNTLINSDSSIHVLDIGVGTSAIYPLLGYAKYGWRFTGSDIDPLAVEWATKNVSLNQKIKHNIKIVKVDDSLMFQKALGQILPRPNAIVIKANSNNVHHNIINDRKKKICIYHDDDDKPIVVNHQNISNNIAINDTNMDGLYMFLKHDYDENNNNSKLFRGPLRQALLASDSMYSTIIEEEEFNTFNNITDNSILSNNNDLLITACMTNPPFYSIDEDIISYDNTVCTASMNEKVTEGGEVAFLAAIIADSIILRNKCCWFTVMTGKKSTIATLHQLLTSTSPCPIPTPTIISTKFMPGKTVRYGLAWSWISCTSTSNKIYLNVTDFINTLTNDELSSTSSNLSLLSSSELLDLVLSRIRNSLSTLSNNNTANSTNYVLDTTMNDNIIGTALSDNIKLFTFSVMVTIGNGDNIDIDITYSINNVNIKNKAIKFFTDLKNDILRTNRAWRRSLLKTN